MNSSLPKTTGGCTALKMSSDSKLFPGYFFRFHAGFLSANQGEHLFHHCISEPWVSCCCLQEVLRVTGRRTRPVFLLHAVLSPHSIIPFTF